MALMLTTNLALFGLLLTLALLTVLYGSEKLLTRLYSRPERKRGQYDPSPHYWSWPQHPRPR